MNKEEILAKSRKENKGRHEILLAAFYCLVALGFAAAHIWRLFAASAIL